MKDLTLPPQTITDAEGREWRLMPVEADDAMCAAEWDVSMSEAHSNGGVSAAAWRAMQAVAPKFPGPAPDPVWCSCGDAIMPDTGAKCGVCASGVALGGEKGEAVAGEKLNELLDAYAEIAHQNGVEFCAGNEGDLEGELTAKRAVLALFAATVCKARMPLTELNELAKVHASSYASPHHITFTVDGLRELIESVGSSGDGGMNG